MRHEGVQERATGRKRVWDASHERAGKRLPEIVAAAAKVFREKGYKEATLEDIANEVGMLKGSLYYYITKKEDLLYAVVERPLRVMTENLRRIAQSSDPPMKKLEDAMRNHVAEFQRSQTELFVWCATEWFKTEIGGEIAALGDEYDRLWRGIVLEGVKTGVFRQDLDPKLMTFAILGIFNYMQRWYSPDKGMSMEDIGLQFAAFVRQAVVAL